LLQVSDIVAPEHGGVEIQKTVSQAQACLDQSAPRLATAHPVDP
jgi:hypothetical protein